MPIVKRFRRFHSNSFSTRQVVTKISSLVSGSNVEQSGRSYSTPVTSNKAIRRKVKSADRRVMLESFVNKYRAMNMGKFPSPTSAQREVGGSYYSIRKMLQEMEYTFKMSPVEKGPTKENTKQTKGDEALCWEIAMESPRSEEKPNSQITIDQNLFQDPQQESGSSFDKKSDTGNSNNANEEKKQIKRDDALSWEIAMESPGSLEERNSQKTIDQNPFQDPQQESGSSFDKKPDTGNSNIASDDTHHIATERDEKPEQNPRDDNFAFKDLEQNDEKQPDEIRNIMRGDGEKDDKLREKTSLWGNLKSLATEFINRWKK